jgi:hypothetical protein
MSTAPIAQGPVDVNVSRMAAERGTPQYYYNDNACKAKTAYDADCICWYDEGTGPSPDGRPDDPDTLKEWRFKPANAGD